MRGAVARRGVLALACGLAWFTTGCFDPVFSAHPSCGPGGACPVGTQCLRDVCVDTACDRAGDAAPCANASVEDGVCRLGSCVARGCGDGIRALDASGRPEACDDGNQLGGDGCSADCLSDETCGNGVVDSIAGETCDDASPGRSRDGCSSLCAVETVDWRELVPAALTPRFDTALAFDARRGRTVMFGGTERRALAERSLAETWEYDGANWASPGVPVPPPALARAATAFDEARGRTVLLDGARGDTWEYDGAAWRKRPVPPCPAPGDITYDARRGRVVAFASAPVPSTWQLDDSGWTAIATPHLPPAPPDGSAAAIAYDRARGRVELLDGAALWELDGADWAVRAVDPAPVPPPGTGAASLVFDAARGRLVLVRFGATGIALYALDAPHWTLIPTQSQPQARYGAAVTYDSIRGVMVLFGGFDPIQRLISFVDTWEFDGTDWAARPRALETRPNRDGLLAFDPERGTALLFAGSDAWELDAASWHLRPGAGIPDPGCSNDAIAFDSVRHRIVAFGGCTSGVGMTWAFDGTGWTPLATAHAPAPVTGGAAAMTYDAARDRIVLFNGTLIETWQFDGQDWAPFRFEGSGPGARFGEVMAFDAERRVTVLFGGSHRTEDGAFSVSDTWEFDGARWTERTPAHEPIPRVSPALAYDPGRRRIVLFGGGPLNPDQIGNTAPVTDVWEYDGIDWSLRTTITPPQVATGQRMVYDSVRRRLLVAGIASWALGFVSDTPTELCVDGFDSDGDGLAGCADPDCAAQCAQCGDAVCNAILESAVCPADCGP
jgi:cysteine-rich repeat protein